MLNETLRARDPHVEHGSVKGCFLKVWPPTGFPRPAVFSDQSLSDQLFPLHTWHLWGWALPILSPLTGKAEKHLFWATEQRTQCPLAAELAGVVRVGWASVGWGRVLTGCVPTGARTGGRPPKLEEEGEVTPGFQVLA